MEEIVDVVDMEDRKIGTSTRRDVHASGAWHRGVHVLLFNSNGELLLQRRSARKDKAPGALDLSVSEHTKAGESYEEAALRGLREELGVRTVPIARVLKFRMVYGTGDNMVSVLFRCEFGGEVRPDASEVEGVIAVDDQGIRRLASGKGEKTAPWAREVLRWYSHLPSAVEEVA